MYPGTYQPLQALALLLADLLENPHSDESATSRGLIDTIFELYEVDRGMISQNDAPQRQLSPWGREAWSMLGRTRKVALEQMGQDSHVLMPLTRSPSGVCICGEIILRGSQQPPEASTTEEIRTHDDADSLPSMVLDTRPAGTDGHSLTTPGGETDPVRSGFDWDEWDAFLGDSAGLML